MGPPDQDKEDFDAQRRRPHREVLAAVGLNLDGSDIIGRTTEETREAGDASLPTEHSPQEASHTDGRDYHENNDNVETTASADSNVGVSPESDVGNTEYFQTEKQQALEALDFGLTLAEVCKIQDDANQRDVAHQVSNSLTQPTTSSGPPVSSLSLSRTSNFSTPTAPGAVRIRGLGNTNQGDYASESLQPPAELNSSLRRFHHRLSLESGNVHSSRELGVLDDEEQGPDGSAEPPLLRAITIREALLVEGAAIDSTGSATQSGEQLVTITATKKKSARKWVTIGLIGFLLIVAAVVTSALVLRSADAPRAGMVVPTMAPTISASGEWSNKSVIEFVQEHESLNQFDLILGFTDFAVFRDTLAQDEKMITFFAPNDAAIGALPSQLFGRFTSSDAWLPHIQSLLMYHIVPQELYTMEETGNFLSANGQDMIEFREGSVNNFTIVTPDISLSNGVAHIIDEVMLCPAVTRSILEWMQLKPELSVFTSLVERIPSVKNLLQDDHGPLTVFAPQNEAFDNGATSVLHQYENTTDEALLAFLETHILVDRAFYAGKTSTRNEQIELFMDGMYRWVYKDYTNVAIGNASSADEKVLLDNDMEEKVGSGFNLATLNRTTSTVPDVLAVNGILHVMTEALMPGE